MTIGAIVPLPTGTSPAVFTPIGADAVLVRVVRALLGPSRALASHTVVAAAQPLAHHARECLAAAGLSSVPVVSVIVAPTPGDRWHCLNAGLEYLAGSLLSPAQVLIHDHRHPLAAASVTDAVIAELRHGQSVVVPVTEVTDSVKAVGSDGSVAGTVDRADLRTVQFPRGVAVAALSALLAEHRTGDFDELAAALRAGTPISTVSGDAGAIRVELPGDSELLDATTAARPHR